MSKPRLTIIGLGLIGGSLGLALHQAGVEFEIVGHDREHSVAGQARKMGAVDRTEWNLISACEGAEAIIIATPVMAIKDIFTAVGPYLERDCIVTDTADTKQMVMQWAEDILPPTVSFIGGNPVVGAEAAGLEAARANLFDRAVYCLFPAARARPSAVKFMTSMVTLLGARPYFLDPVEHDGLVAGVNHLPFVLSIALLGSTTGSVSWREMARLAGYPFETATHFASSDPTTYRDACLTNRPNILRWIDTYLENLQQLREVVAAADGERLETLFNEALETRARWVKTHSVEEPVSEAWEEARSWGLRDFLWGRR